MPGAMSDNDSNSIPPVPNMELEVEVEEQQLSPSIYQVSDSYEFVGESSLAVSSTAGSGPSTQAISPRPLPPAKRQCHKRLISSPAAACDGSSPAFAGRSSTSPRRPRASRRSRLSQAQVHSILNESDDDLEDDFRSSEDIEVAKEEFADNLDFAPPRFRTIDSDDDEPADAFGNRDWQPQGPNIEEQDDVDTADPFVFKWRPFGPEHADSASRRLQFSNDGCGPTVETDTPYDAFVQIWDRSIVEHIVTETNKHAQHLAGSRFDGQGVELRPRSRISEWKDTTVDEIYRFFAVIMAMGIVVKSRLSDYWDSDVQSIFRTPGFGEIMSIRRFQILSRCLHFSSFDDSQPRSRLHKLSPILDHLNRKFKSLYKPRRNLVLDESLTLWKGRLNIKQFMKKKAASEGIKSYEVCESETGYLYRFEIHSGEHQGIQETPLSGTVPTLVLRLLEGLEHRGHTVWMDNFYNSPALARELRNRGFDCVGTLSLKRQLVPVELKKLTLNDLAPGEVRGCTSGDVDLLVWRSKINISFISTYHGLATSMDKGTLKPSIVPDYNVCMGGVDTKDQELAMYPIERVRQRHWYKKMFKRLLNVSILNAYIIHKAQHRHITHRQFRYQLVHQLLQKHPMPRFVRTISPRQPVIPTAPCVPMEHEAGSVGERYNKVRRQCVVCKKRTSWYCRTCLVSLCINTCFAKHVDEVYARWCAANRSNI